MSDTTKKLTKDMIDLTKVGMIGNIGAGMTGGSPAIGAMGSMMPMVGASMGMGAAISELKKIGKK